VLHIYPLKKWSFWMALMSDGVHTCTSCKRTNNLPLSESTFNDRDKRVLVPKKRVVIQVFTKFKQSFVCQVVK
jgi:hypothetical protein